MLFAQVIEAAHDNAADEEPPADEAPSSDHEHSQEELSAHQEPTAKPEPYAEKEQEIVEDSPSDSLIAQSPVHVSTSVPDIVPTPDPTESLGNAQCDSISRYRCILVL